jgi:hypothetical protein
LSAINCLGFVEATTADAYLKALSGIQGNRQTLSVKTGGQGLMPNAGFEISLEGIKISAVPFSLVVST